MATVGLPALAQTESRYFKNKKEAEAHGNARHAGHAKKLCHVSLGFAVQVLGKKKSTMRVTTPEGSFL